MSARTVMDSALACDFARRLRANAAYAESCKFTVANLSTMSVADCRALADWLDGAAIREGRPVMTATADIDPAPFVFSYRNWRGEVSDRRVIPIRVWFGATEWHPEPQWFLNANDLDKGDTRDFALRDVGARAMQAAMACGVRVKALDWEHSEHLHAAEWAGGEYIIFTRADGSARLRISSRGREPEYSEHPGIEAAIAAAQADYEASIRSALEPAGAQEGAEYTYASTQATTCCQCGEMKHTPLRVDRLGGYICLTCIDRELHRKPTPAPEADVAGLVERVKMRLYHYAHLVTSKEYTADDEALDVEIGEKLLRDADRIEALQAEVAGLKSELQAANEEVDDLQEECANAETETNRLTARAETAEASLAAAREQTERMREALRGVRASIMEASRFEVGVIVDTLWMHESPAETVIDHIDAALGSGKGG